MIVIVLVLLGLQAIFAQSNQPSYPYSDNAATITKQSKSPVQLPTDNKLEVKEEENDKLVSQNTEKLKEAIARKDWQTALGFVDEHTILVIHTSLPFGGVYKGVEAIKMYTHKLKATAEAKTQCKVLFVNEIRGISAIECTCNGVFHNGNRNFNDLKTIHYVKWRMNKISKVNIVYTDMKKVLTSYESPAEKQFSEFQYRLFGNDDAKNMIASDAQFSMNLYPAHLLRNVIHALSGSTGASKGASKVAATGTATGAKVEAVNEREGSSEIVLKGEQGFAVLDQLANRFILDRTMNIKQLHSDNTSVVAVWILTPRIYMLRSDFINKKAMLRDCTLMYTITKFNEQGKLMSIRINFNRAFLPWEIRSLQSQVQLVEKELSHQ